jgi:asparagine N-glycosylation enzyme membrane subunit Stt3
MENNTTPTEQTGTRPTFLTVLCILSFIAAGFAIIGYVLVITAMGAASAIASNMEGMSGEAGQAAAMMNEAMSKAPSMGLTWAYIIVGFVTVLVSLFGVIKMWKLQKIGNYLYVGASVVSMIMGIIYSGFGVMGVLFPILFIVLYGLNLKHLK